MPRIKYKTEIERKEAEYLRKKKWAMLNKEKVEKSRKNYFHNNKEKVKITQSKYRKNNSEKEKKRHIKYLTENKEKRKETTKKYREKNRKKINKKARENKEKRNKNHKIRYDNNSLYKLTCNIRAALGNSLRNGGYSKKSRSHEILGCSFEYFKEHIESQFIPWMTWNNHGLYNGEFNYGWDIDHRVPLSSAKTEEELLKLFHYTNLQPLCGRINRIVKRDSLIHNQLVF